MIKEFVRRKAIISAVQFTGDNHQECMTFVDGNFDNTLSYPNIIMLDMTVEVEMWDYLLYDELGRINVMHPDEFEFIYQDASLENVECTGSVWPEMQSNWIV